MILFSGAFVFVFLKSLQQLNVANKTRWLIVPISLGMAFCGVLEITIVSKAGIGFNTVLPIGFGGGLGSIAATYAHPWIARII